MTIGTVLIAALDEVASNQLRSWTQVGLLAVTCATAFVAAIAIFQKRLGTAIGFAIGGAVCLGLLAATTFIKTETTDTITTGGGGTPATAPAGGGGVGD